MPSPSLPLLTRHPCHHRSCRRCPRPLCPTPLSLPTPWPVPPLPSSLTGTLIAVTIALASLPSLSLPSQSAARPCRLLSPTVMVVWCLVDALLPATAHLCRSRRWLIDMIIQCFQTQGIHQQGGQGGHIEEPVKSALLSAGRCVHGEPTGEPTRGDLMVGEAGTRMSYHSSGGALITSCHSLLRRLAMVGCCVLC